MSDDPSTEALLFQVLSYDVLCTGLLDYLIAVYLGRDAYCAGVIEREFVERKDSAWKRRTLRDLLKREGMDHDPLRRPPRQPPRAV